jgi:transcriptional regulator with XRE-family HTH domain
MELIKIFTRNMKKWRKIAGISQEKLAERCNSAHSYIRQIECGSRYPSFSFVEKIAKALNIEPYQLFYDEIAAKTAASEIQSIETELLGTISDDIHKAFEKFKT